MYTQVGTEAPRSPSSSYLQRFKDFFLIDERGTTIETEIRAGIVTFLTMSYILLVNPQILAQVGYPANQVVVATAVASGVASLICGIFGNLPFGMAPGAGLSVYLTYGLVIGGTMTRTQAMTTCFFSGIFLGLFSVLGIANVVMKFTPHGIKLATVVGMGLLIALIGMVSIHLVEANPKTIVGLGDLNNVHIWLSLGGLALIGTLLYHQVKGSILIGIIVVTVIVWILDKSGPSQFVESPHLKYGITDNIQFKHLIVDMIGACLAFIFVAIFDMSGVMFGMSSLAKLSKPDGSTPGTGWAFMAAAIGTVLSAALGSTPIIVQVETAAGIREGGRTGLTGVTIGMLFLLSTFLAPIFSKVPQTATAPVLILVGAMMMGESKQIDWTNMQQAVPAFLTTVMMPSTYSITNGILFGLLTSMAFFVTTTEKLWPMSKAFANHEGEGGHHEGRTARTVDNTAEDYQPLIRRPTLILKKEDVETFDATIEAASPIPSRR